VIDTGTILSKTTGAIISFLHSLFLYPDVAQRMFEEVQSITHGQRLPKVSDISRLSYCLAVFKESIRRRPFLPLGQLELMDSYYRLAWAHVLPLGVPHVNDSDEILRGYLIPKGTVIHQNNG
jgi:hypothetical protein